MDASYDYKKFAILYVDDEEKSLKYFARAFSEQFRIYTAPNALEGFALLEKHADDIAILMTDQRMPGEKGTWLLEKARQLRPNLVRILATAYSDMDAAIAAVNTGSIYKYITKPWDPPQLESTLKRGLEFFIVQRERDQLLSEKIATLQRLLLAERVLGLGRLAAGLSHHVRNALVPVKTFVDLAPDKLKAEGVAPQQSRSPAFWVDCQQKAAGQVGKITILLRELLDASGPGFKGFQDQVPLRTAVEAAIARHAQALDSRKFQIENHVSELLPVLTADRFQIDRMLDLLFKDELASLPDGSQLTIAATHRPASAGEPERIVLDLADNGPGQSAELLKALFDPFVVRRDSPQEFGINLMAVYFIVHYHGGRIEALNAKPEGTLFRITLPVHCEVASLKSDDPQLLERARQNERHWEQLKTAE